MEGSLDELYLSWLYAKVSSVKQRNRSRTFWSLLGQLHSTEFIWLIPNDDNRVEDGRDLRYEFSEETGAESPDHISSVHECSMLEMLIALSRWLSFEADGEPSAWFWHLIETLEIKYCDRDYTPGIQYDVDMVLKQVINRTYAPDGRGGLFPLQHPTEDQRFVEIWYQLNAYLIELNN